MKKNTFILLGGLLLGCVTVLSAQTLPANFEKHLKSASVSVSGDTLIASTGKMERKWILNEAGLRTVSVKDLSVNKEWGKEQPNVVCDWDLPGAITPTSKAVLKDIEAKVSDDDGFINEHLEIVTTFQYDSARLELQHVVWLFPDANGLRTQLRVKALEGFKSEGLPEKETSRNYFGHTLSVPSGRVEYLPLDYSVKNQRRYWGYYNNPGSRHDQSRDMLKEEVVVGYPVFQDEDINWASCVSSEYENEGVIVVKESHKCMNQQGHNTGSFYAGPQGLFVTGWGLNPNEIVSDRFRECWANWTIVYSGGEGGMQLALKKFDRTRYPVFAERDIMIINDTWGPANPGGGQFAAEDYLLKEIPLLADLGVDVLRIDDGWQINPWGGEKEVFRPSYEDGWKNIIESCKKNDVKLGLWIAIQRAKQKDLLQNLKEANVVTWKVDFDHLNNRSAFENRFKGIREVMKNAWMKTQFSFCPEYDDPRYGWYYAKEYGSIYFQNIQEALPEHLIMVPYHVLRQHWLMSKYFNSNKLQVLLQNPKRVDTRYSDADKHGHGYCFAMGLPFIPVFFQSAQYLDEAGRKELKSLISLYKEHREKMFDCYSFPIGETPTNASWAGFQFINDKQDEGYLLLFRELHNGEVNKPIQLKFLAGKKLKISNLKSKQTKEVEVSKDGSVTFTIDNPADYSFLQYKVM
ncbi:hypothetical protein DXD68_07245 [Parabacteroides sp. TM07-1AC]|uniref:hypothetical protein n=1 Tax=Parabacteroides sp. TM07-1AC TaxID=2292363 RepID=UPI000F008247|nr:hypothetical protein [Parabacteroides sp. TM07-1AC]RHU29236.1 hypothetical protein DXD68_07245 [Parabacteroides sp. TM07-1AC]